MDVISAPEALKLIEASNLMLDVADRANRLGSQDVALEMAGAAKTMARLVQAAMCADAIGENTGR